jgi:CPA1 family monovalent cation:H+ antiporter
MAIFEITIALLIGGVLLAALARRIATPYPALVALAGAALALFPGVPTITLDPELALALFVAPVLLDAAFDSSPRDLQANWRSVTGLAIGAVILTVAVVAVVARALVPDMPWAAAIALGAIVAPPDAAAATAVLRQLRPPFRLLVILEGESLFNDASALLIYRLAIGAVLVGSFSSWSVLPTLLVVTAGSIVLGLVLSRVMTLVIARIEDVATAVIFQFCNTFAVWILAERLHLSGILTMVVFAMAASRQSALATPARLRIPSYAVWEVAVFVLNVLAFELVGLQLKSIVERLDSAMLLEYTWVAVVVCAATILARVVWVMGAAALNAWLRRLRRRESTMRTPQAASVVAWCGMRGTVTLAAALALPTVEEGGVAFPYRDLILFTAFGVVLGTLVLQGLTLRPLMLRLRLRDDGAVDREVRLARVETLRAAVAAAENCTGAATAKLVRYRYELQLRRAEHDLVHDGVDENGSTPEHEHLAIDANPDADEAAVRAATDAQRQRLVALRADRTIGDAAFQRIEEELDLAELDWGRLLQGGQSAD